ncbi:MAG TPA: TetR/AcrR family transcriptional regulator [Kribbellaceae bacterium]|jgi:AcrR family transcriptional regulator
MTVKAQRSAPRRTRDQRPGGRSARVKAAVLASVLDELIESGYAGLTVERVAARAGVHKATVYRRWPVKENLVADALLAQTGRTVPMPDTGSVREDLRLLARAVIANITSPQGEGLVRTLVSDAARVPAIAAAARSFWTERFALAGALVQHGIDRGELPPRTDPDFLIESLIAPLYLRLLVTKQPLTDEYADRVVDSVLAVATTRDR